jgi:hypothetical protein
MSRLKRLLHVAGPSPCNTQQTTVQACNGVAQHAHSTQQRLLHVARPSPCNTQQGAALPDPAAEAELRRLVNVVADAHGFSPEDRREALEVALRDRENALTCFRLLAKECGSPVH